MAGSAAKVANYTPSTARQTGERMTPLDLRAQAALIHSEVMKLDQAVSDFILAMYAWDEQGFAAFARLSVRIKEQLAGDHVTVALVERHIQSVRGMFVVPLREFARRQEIGHKAARYREGKVREALGLAWTVAEGLLDERWLETGLIRP